MTEITRCPLDVARQLYAALSARAAAATTLIERLRSFEVEVSKETLVKNVASTIYYSSAYDAHERYDCIEEFEMALREDMDESLISRDCGDVPRYVIRPYFNAMPDIELRGAPVYILLQYFFVRKELVPLAVPVFEAPSCGIITGITESEIAALTEHYHHRSLALVNALRVLKTALISAESGLKRHNLAELGMTSEAEALVLQLSVLADLPSLPPVARWFGTDADRMNPLSSLPSEFVSDIVSAS